MTMVEKVAQAILNASVQSAGRSVLWTDDDTSWPAERIREEARACARAAIAAMREPTEAMVDAGWNASQGQGCFLEWQAMVDAALAESGDAR
jgi:hypothetical protein